MARKLVPLDEAAKTLGVSSEELNSMRENREIYGYRDGASWKFKPEDVERLALELAERGSRPASDSSSLPVDLDDSHDDGDDIVLLSESALGGSAGGSSTVIGSPANLQSPEDSDIKLSLGSSLEVGALEVGGIEVVGSGSSTVISKPGDLSGESSVTIRLAGESDHAGSDVLPIDDDAVIGLAQGGSGRKDGPGSDLMLATDMLATDMLATDMLATDMLATDMLATEQTVGEGVGSDLAVGPGSDLVLVTGGSSGKIVGDGPGSDLTLGGGDDDVFQVHDTGGGSAIRLADEPPGTGPGSDITISPGDSGINLIDPSDSGISLEDPLELSSADDESSFDLGDSSGDSSGTLGDSADFDSDAVMELQSEDEFLLTPLEESLDDESQDSGSQVIALDSDTEFDDASPTVMGGSASSVGALLEPEDAGVDFGGGGLGLGGGLGGAAAAPSLAMAPGGMMMTSAREAPYSVLQMVLLSFCILALAMTGMMTFDLMRNMWSWDGAYTANSVLMDKILEMF